MVCCRCNRTGRCLNCSCVKGGRACESCLPRRLGHCVNTTQITPPSQADAAPPQASSASIPGLPTPSDSTLSAPLNTLPLLSPEQLATLSASFSTDLSTLTTTVPSAEVTPTTGTAVELPAFSPTGQPTFTWGLYDSMTFILTLSMLYMKKLCTGGRTYLGFPLAGQAKPLSLNLQGCTGCLPLVLLWSALL